MFAGRLVLCIRVVVLDADDDVDDDSSSFFFFSSIAFLKHLSPISCETCRCMRMYTE